MSEKRLTTWFSLFADLVGIIGGLGGAIAIVVWLAQISFGNLFTNLMPELVLAYWKPLTSGIITTLKICSIAIIFGTIFGVIIGHWLARRTKNYTTWLARTMLVIFVYIFLCIPLFVLLLFLYHSRFLGLIQGEWIAAIALTINLTPFAAKIFSAGLKNISAEQIENARIAGYKERDIWLRFRMPLLFRNVGQPLLVQYITTLKLSALASYIGVPEIFHAGQEIIRDTYDVQDGYFIVALIYIIIILPLIFIADRLERRARLAN